MALNWQPTSIEDIYEGSTANDGTGDSIREAFLKVDRNFQNITSFFNGGGSYAAGPQFSTLAVTSLNSNVAVLGNITLGNVNSSTTFYGNINAAANIVPTVSGQYDLGSAARPFRNLYVQATVATSQVQTSTDAGLLTVHANAVTGDTKDVGIFGNVSHSFSNNTYAFFGYQKTTNNFVYKLTNTDATLGNSVVYDGVYGNVQFGALFLNNTTPATSNVTGALIVAGGISSNNDIYARGNVYSQGYRLLNTADVNTLGYPTYYGSGSLFLGNTVFATTTPSTSTNTGAVVVLGGVGVAGNISAGGYLGNFWGNITNPVQTGITTVGTLGNLTVSSTINTNSMQATSVGATNILATSISTGTISATSTVIAPTINANIIGNLGATLTGTVSTAAQPNITSVGTLTSLAVSGNITSANVTTGNIASSANITAINIGVGSIYSTGYKFANGLPFSMTTIANTSEITSNLTVGGNVGLSLVNSGVTAGTYGSTTAIPSIVVDAKGRITTAGTVGVSTTHNLAGTSGTGSISNGGTLTFAGTYGVTATVSASTITVGTPQDLRITSSPTFGNAAISNDITINGNLTVLGSAFLAAGQTDLTIQDSIINMHTFANLAPWSSDDGKDIGFKFHYYKGGDNLAFLGWRNDTGYMEYFKSGSEGVGNVFTGGTYGTIKTGNIILTGSAGNAIVHTGHILPTAGNTYNLGSTSNWYNNVYGRAINALYADLAEKYTSDAEYEPGTVLVFGGKAEVTTTIEFADSRVAGAVSSEPAYLMNSALEGVSIALRGRIPVKVIGPVQKGDLLVTSTTPGFAQSVGTDRLYSVSVFAKSLVTDLSGGEKVIEAVIL